MLSGRKGDERVKPGEITQDQTEIVAFLADPATHGGAVVERLETHGAMVFLAGDRAIKLKRAVWFPYMDYSTVARRRAACEAEIRLNRRTAPTLYEAALPITRSRSGALAIDGEGAPVDWIVCMKRFAQEGLFDALARRGALDEALMLELADAVARFHHDVERRPDRGGSEALAELIAGNDRQLRVFVPAVFAADRVAALDRASRAALASCAALLEARRATGFVRHGHGDLHLRNICLFEGRPTLFDCIEFDESIACVDTIHDLAFLLMDLEYRGLRPLANAAFNRYLARSGDPGALAALPLFLSCRAAVRAHVGAAVAARQSDVGEAEALRDEARGYLDLALDFLRPPPPRLVAVGGLSGTGKTTLAHDLAAELGAAPGAVILRSDLIRKRLLGRGMFEHLPESAYDPAVGARVFETLAVAAEAALAAGHSVVADAVFRRSSERAAIARAARRIGASFTGLWLEVDAAERLRRVAERAAGPPDASDATAAVARVQRDVDPRTLDWRRIDARGDRAAVARKARAVLAGKDRGGPSKRGGH